MIFGGCGSLIREVWKSHSGGAEVSFGRCGSLMRQVWISMDFHGFPWIPWISVDFDRFLRDVEKYLKMCRPRILIESARFPPFGFDITEMSSNSYENNVF